MPTTCLINFENPDGVYFAGELLRGTAILTLTKAKKVRGIYVRIFGRAYAHWTRYCSIDHNPGRDENGKLVRRGGHRVSYTGSEEYLDQKTYFIGGSETETFKLDPGTYAHRFQCSLPHALPTSVLHDIGHIIYGVEIVLDIPVWPNKVFSANFTVVKRIDLNIDPSYRIPITNTKEKTFYGFLCCCPSGPLMIDATTKVRGYAPGQTISVRINVFNESKKHVDYLEVQLIKQITFYGKASQPHHYGHSQKDVTHVIAEETTRGFDPGEKDRIYVNLRVPPIPPTDSNTSRIVKVNYLIRITASIVACYSSSTSFDLPITIGTIPLRDNFNASGGNLNSELVISVQPGAAPALSRAEIEGITPMHMHMPIAPNLPFDSNEPSTSNAPSAPPAPIDFSDNPPTYEEAMHMGLETSNNTFKPKYPMFKRQTSYSIGHH